MTNADIEKSAAMLWCSFCGKNQYQVRKMVAAPGTLSNALICNECVELCVIALRDPVTVENATPKSVEKTTDNQSGPLQCSFCCKTRYEVGKLIAGLDIYICNECVELCLVVQYQESKDNVDADQELPQDAASSPDVTPYCGFCGKERYGVAKLFEGRGAYICNECLEICEHAVRLKPDVSVRDVLSKTTPEEFSDDDLEGARRHSAAVLGPDHPDTLNSLSNLMATRRVAEDGVTLPGYAPVIPDAGARNDRLAAWRPDAPVPKEEALLLARIEALGNGNSLEKLVDLAKEYDAEGRHADAAVAY